MRLLLCIILINGFLLAQSSEVPKSIEAVRSTSTISVDGILDEPIWQRQGAADFTQRDPDEGAQPSQRTEVWVAYDDAALYIAARLYDTAPDSIVTRLGRRDADLNSDWFYFGVDSYHDKRNAFYFGVSAGGSIQDGIFYNDEWSDGSWDGVWDAAATVNHDGWTAEFRVPYSQLRFSRLDEYVWGINFLRIIDRWKEEDYFVMVPKKESGFVSRFANLTGIREINPPGRLEILPYVAAGSKFLQHEAGDPFNDGSVFTNNIGADVKVGIGSNLTLNATFNPDFGQVEVDPAVVNLTQYETFFEEKRPFFVEGSSFFSFGSGGVNNNWGFNWGNPNYFYSRRVGRPPRGEVQHSGFSNIPDRTHILGAAKLTGKISEGWSLGTLHALTARECAQVDSMGMRFEDVVEPFAYNGVVRTLREFNDGHQGLGFIGTATMRDLSQPYLVDDFNRRAYAAGVDGWTNLDEDRTYVMAGWVSATKAEGTPDRILSLQTSPLHYFQRPDASHIDIDSTASSLTGYAGRVAVNRQKGNFRFNSAVGFITPRFTSNDLGFMFQTDRINIHVVVGYQWFDPDGVFRRKGFNAATFRNYNFGGTKVGEGYFLFYGGQFMNYWGFESNIVVQPGVLDDRYARGGPLMRTTNFYGTNQYFYSDSREAVVFSGGIFAGRSESGGYRVNLFPGIEWKPSSGVAVRTSLMFTRDVTIAQWIGSFEDATATSTYGHRYVFGKLDQKEFSGNIRLDWTFTPKLSLQLFVQPLVSVGGYMEFKELKQPGTYTFNRYGEGISTIEFANGKYTVDPDGAGSVKPFTFENPDFNFKSLRGNAVLRWEYLPGSTLFLVWTQERLNFDNPGEYRFGRDFSKLLDSSPNNVLLLKVAYWLNP
jgi:hypothetical protein